MIPQYLENQGALRKAGIKKVIVYCVVSPKPHAPKSKQMLRHLMDAVFLRITFGAIKIHLYAISFFLRTDNLQSFFSRIYKKE